MKKLFLFLLLPSLLTILSCEKSEEPDPVAPINNHITFKVDNVLVEAKFKVLLQDAVFNAYYKSTEGLELMRLVKNGSTEGLYLKIDRINLETAVFPVVITYSSSLTTPTVGVLYTTDSNVLFGSNPNPADFSITINSYENNILNCDFSGSLFSGGPSYPKVAISEGTLNLEIVEYE